MDTLPVAGGLSPRLHHVSTTRIGAGWLGAALVLAAATAWAQTSAPASSLTPAAPLVLVDPVPATAPATAPAVVVTPALTTATAPTTGPIVTTAPAAVQALVATVTADHVYVRSGPGTNYYEIGQLMKGDTVQVVGQKQGWYQIAPPIGTYDYIAKDLVDLDAGGQSATVKAEFVNVRAASAIHPPSDHAIVAVVRKGAKITVLGAEGKYYKVLPPEKAYVYISSQLVKAAAEGTAYTAPTLHLPAGITSPATSRPAVAVELPTTPTTEPLTLVTPVPPAPEPTPPTPVPVPPVPAPAGPNYYAQFNALNAKTQAEFNKPLMERDLKGLRDQYAALADTANIPAGVKQSSEDRVATLDKLIVIQNIAKQNNSVEGPDTQQKAIEEQWSKAEQALREYEASGPLLAEGRLQASTSVAHKYVLINPATGRVNAYVDPNSAIDVSTLVGQYIGVRGTTVTPEGTAFRVIKVSTATLMAAPSSRPATP